MDNNAIGLRIKVLRTENRMKQAELAAQLKLDRTTISKIESGDIVPNAALLLKLRGIFSVSTEWVLTGKGIRALGDAGRHDEEILALISDMDKVPGLKHCLLSEYYAFKAKHKYLFEAPSDQASDNGTGSGNNGN